MSRPYKRLRVLLCANGLDQKDVARALLLSERTVSSRMNRRSEWTLGEAYKLLELLGEPPEALPRLFPRDGKSEGFQ